MAEAGPRGRARRNRAAAERVTGGGEDVGEEAALRATPVEPAREDAARRPQVLILQEPFTAPGIAAALEQRGYAVCAPPREEDSWAAVRDVARAPMLLVLPVCEEEVEGIRRLRRLQVLAAVPILGVTRERGGPTSLEPLRSLGVVGLVDAQTPLEHLVFRVEQIVRPRRPGRRHERVAVFFPVDVAVPDEPFRVLYATTLSAGGMGLLATRPIEPNTDVDLRFHLLPGSDGLERKGRVVYCHEDPSARGVHRVGLFFYPADAAADQHLATEVERRLRG